MLAFVRSQGCAKKGHPQDGRTDLGNGPGAGIEGEVEDDDDDEGEEQDGQEILPAAQFQPEILPGDPQGQPQRVHDSPPARATVSR